MSEATFRVIPPAKPLSEKELRAVRNQSRSCNPCWLCGAKPSIRKYADHAEKHRKEGWKPRPMRVPKRNPVQVFAECCQADATEEDFRDDA